MASAEVKSSTKRYASKFGLSCDISGVHISPGRNEGDIEVDVMRSVRDVDENKRRKWVYPLRFSNDLQTNATNTGWEVGRPFEQSDSCSFVSYSPSRKRSVRIMTVKKGVAAEKGDTCIEIWEGLELKHRSCVTIHEKVYTSSQGLGGLSWSQDESKIVYVAERKPASSVKSFFAAEKETAGDTSFSTETESHSGEEYEYRDDWGEQLIGSDRLSLFTMDIASGEVCEVTGCCQDGESNFTPSQPVFSKDGSSIIFVAYPHHPKKLGLIYCIQRPCQLRRLVLSSDNSEHMVLTPEERIAFSPRLSHNGDKLVYLCSNGFDTHCGALSIKLFSMDAEGTPTSSQVLHDAESVSVEPTPLDKSNNNHGFTFPGFWFPAGLPEDCWDYQDNAIWFTSFWGSSPTSFYLDTSNGNMEALNPSEGWPGSDPVTVYTSLSILAALPNQTGCLVKWSTPINPGGIALIRLNKVDEDAKWCWSHAPSLGRQVVTHTVLSPQESIEDQFSWNVLSLLPPDSISQVPIEGILLIPKQDTESPKSLGLIVVPHGGPHSASPTSFLSSYAFLSQETQCGILHVNYRGSIGFGTKDLETLPGNVGRQDVDDMMLMTNHALTLQAREQPLFDKNQVGVVGGSHGGFLGGHLIGQYGDVFKVAALRNPVINMASLCGISDIPDWCAIEALGIGKYDFDNFLPVQPEDLKIMFERSPMAHVNKVKSPTLLALGAKDRRVVCSQGVEFYHILKSRGIPVRMLMYPEDCHPIDKPASEADHWINIANWINDHIAR